MRFGKERVVIVTWYLEEELKRWEAELEWKMKIEAIKD